ncbi:MAG: tRNA (adenosine(37)-N6)-dimethylallyltransferase MiaA, partial [Bacteroidetes bacterium]|nr:tRNA (adenosine(37)-N6)-dimethylallyltransferase MiaA [Bacteroidota bacterium]
MRIADCSDTGPFPIITGPTAVGKTSLSLELAGRLGADIISADSRQIYRELTIGTAKPTPEERARVPHHFIDEINLGTPFSAGAFARQASERIRDIVDRGRLPLIVGGSTLYLHALQFGLADIPPVSSDVRRRLDVRLDEEGADVLFDELNRFDPASAATLDPTKTQRLVRALEVYHGTGLPLSSYHKDQEPPPFTFNVIVLNRDRKALYARINQRVDGMLECGLLDEVRGLLERGVDPAEQALQTIGYQEPIAYLRGAIDYDEMVRLIKRNSRRYAKRQLTWFRRYPDYQRIPADTALDFFDL